MAKQKPIQVTSKERTDLLKKEIAINDRLIDQAEEKVKQGVILKDTEEKTLLQLKNQNKEKKKQLRASKSQVDIASDLSKRMRNLSESGQEVARNSLNWSATLKTIKLTTDKTSDSAELLNDLSKQHAQLGLTVLENQENLNSKEHESVDLSSHLNDLYAARKQVKNDISLDDEKARKQYINIIDAEIKTAVVLEKQAKMKDLIIDKTDELNGKISDMQKKWDDVKAKVVSIVKNPITALKVGILAIGVGLVAMGKKMFEFGNETGFSYTQLSEFGPAVMFAKDEMNALLTETGSLNGVTYDTLIDMKLLSHQYGVSAESAAKLSTQIMAVSGLTREAALDSLKMVGSLARAEGVAPAAVMEDIAENSEFFASFAKAGGDNLTMAAIEARKLGINLGTVSKISDGLLDFESSIEKSMEASVLLGRNINLDRARGLAINGNVVEMQREVLSLVGSQSQFESMNVIQRRALADAIGVGVDELSKMIVNQENLNKRTDKQIASDEARADMIESLKKAIMALNVAIQPFVTSLGEKVIPYLEWMVENLGTLVKWTGTFVALWAAKKLATGIWNAGAGILSMMKNVKTLSALGLSKGITAIKNMGSGGLSKDNGGRLRDAKGRFAKAPKPKGKGGLGFVEKMNPKKMLAGAAAMLIISAALFVTAKALIEFNKVDWPSLGKAALALGGLVLAVLALGAIMTSGVGTVAILAGAAAMAIMAGGLLVLGLAIQSIATGFAMLEPTLAKLAPMTASILSLGGALGELGWGMTKLAGGALLLTPFLPVLGKLTGLTTGGNVNVSGDGNMVSQSTDMKETNGLLTKLVDVNSRLLQQNELLMGKLTNKVADLGVA